MIIPNAEFIEKNFNKTLELVSLTVKDEDRKKKLLDLYSFFGERYATAPASTDKAYHSAFPGGLCYHTLHVLQWIGKFAGLMAPNQYSNECLLTVALLHDIGKVGTIQEDYYRPLASDWHISRGIYYEFNNKINFLRVPNRSLFLSQHFGIALSEEEYLAILLHEGQNDQANSAYKYKEPKLAQILHTSDMWAIKTEKEKEIQYP